MTEIFYPSTLDIVKQPSSPFFFSYFFWTEVSHKSSRALDPGSSFTSGVRLLPLNHPPSVSEVFLRSAAKFLASIAFTCSSISIHLFWPLPFCLFNALCHVLSPAKPSDFLIQNSLSQTYSQHGAFHLKTSLLFTNSVQKARKVKRCSHMRKPLGSSHLLQRFR